MSSELGSYGKIYNLGHRAVRDLLNFPVQVQEKVDGSQFSFGVRNGVLYMRSKRVEIHQGGDNGQFQMAIDTVCDLFDAGKLEEGWTYRGEAITALRHNQITYGRIPAGGIVLFDIDLGQEDMADYGWLCDEVERLGLDVVPQIYVGKIESVEDLAVISRRESVLGGKEDIEGIVIKPTGAVFDPYTGTILRAKVVAPQFREANTKSWKASNQNRGEFLETVTEALATEARWLKAIQSLRDAGELDRSPKDIGSLMRVIQKDILEEEEEAIAAALFQHFWKKSISRGVVRGFPEFYKEYLIKLQFDPTEEEE